MKVGAYGGKDHKLLLPHSYTPIPLFPFFSSLFVAFVVAI